MSDEPKGDPTDAEEARPVDPAPAAEVPTEVADATTPEADAVEPVAEAEADVPTEVVDETTLEEVPVEPVAEADDDDDAEDEPVTPAASTPAASAAAARPARKPAAGRDGAPVVRAHAKYVRTSARKARLVCDHIRGKSVPEARAILAHTPRAVASDWSKLLESAVANAEHNHELLGDDLRILTVTADEGPTLKRFRPRAMGRASAIRKRTSHLSIALTPKEQ
jgi:ribosomal protein L22